MYSFIHTLSKLIKSYLIKKKNNVETRKIVNSLMECFIIFYRKVLLQE